MLSKFSVKSLNKLIRSCTRNFGGLTPLERFEKLRKLCCRSEIAQEREDAENRLRPKAVNVGRDLECFECVDGKPHELLDIRCKVALIFGGSSGIGYETADEALKLGADKVILADDDRCGGFAAVKKLNDVYGDSKATFVMTDISDATSVEAVFRDLYKVHKRLDLYVNAYEMFDETPNQWENMIKTNLIGCTRGTILAYQYLSKNPPDENNEKGCIINVSSYGCIANVVTMPMFSAAANGIIGLTTSFGQDFHYKTSNIRFVAICPSCTESGSLKNFKSRHYDPTWVGHSNVALRCCTRQNPRIVAKAIINAARFGSNGSVYVIKDGKNYKYSLPDYPKYLRQETILL